MATKNKKYLITIDKNMCIGAGNCTQIANEVFSLSKQGKVVLNKGNFLSEYKNTTFKDLVNAANNCPVKAIKIINAKTKSQIFPK